MSLVNIETNKSVKSFLSSIKDKSKREDSKKLVSLIQKVTGKKPKVWGNNFIIGFGKYKYKRKNGKEEFEWFNVGFAPRKNSLTIHLSFDISKEKTLLKKLGKCKYGRGCMHIDSLDSVNLDALKKLISKSKDLGWY